VQVIADYHTPPGKSLQRDLMATINAAVDFLVRCAAMQQTCVLASKYALRECQQAMIQVEQQK